MEPTAPDANDKHDQEMSHQWRRRLGFAVFGVAAAYFLLTEHYAQTVQARPWLLVLACPLMHVFMHRGHGGHRQ